MTMPKRVEQMTAAPCPATAALVAAVRSHDRAARLQQAAYDAFEAAERGPCLVDILTARAAFWARRDDARTAASAVMSAYLALPCGSAPDLARCGGSLYIMAADGTFFRYDPDRSRVLDADNE